MPLTVPSTALRHMTDEERGRLIDEAFAAPPEALANYLAIIDARLRAFEQRYELASSEVAEALRRGVLRDTADVSDWLFWLGVRSRLAREARA